MVPEAAREIVPCNKHIAAAISLEEIITAWQTVVSSQTASLSARTAAAAAAPPAADCPILSAAAAGFLVPAAVDPLLPAAAAYEQGYLQPAQPLSPTPAVEVLTALNPQPLSAAAAI